VSRGARGALSLSLALALALALAMFPGPRARAEDVQVSARLALGGGLELAQVDDAAPGALFELALRAEALFGPPFADRFRIGPALDLRSASFRSLELAAGAMALVPLGSDFAVTAMLGAGYALRDPYEPLLPGGPPQGRDGALAVATLAGTYRPYDHFDAYGHGISLYASGRAAFAGWESWELTVGLEIDLELVVWSPIAFLVTALSARDPAE
jgi:hypothetical protein